MQFDFIGLFSWIFFVRALCVNEMVMNDKLVSNRSVYCECYGVKLQIPIMK